MPQTSTLTPQVIREQLDLILQSKEFSRSEYLCRFLRCCVEQTLHGNVAQLKEFWLGVSVFGRETSFNPSTDPIVRVQARRLRDKLKRYYAGDGREAPFQIVLPTGSYVPHFLGGDQYANLPLSRTSPVSIAILPFADLEHTPESRHFADIFSSELLHHLVQSKRVLVVSRISSLRYRDVSDDVRAVGRALNAAYVAEGSAWGTQGTEHVSLQLTETSSGYHVCSGLFECAGATDRERVVREAAEVLIRSLETRTGAVLKKPVSIARAIAV